MSRTSTARWQRTRSLAIKRALDEGRTNCPICGIGMDFQQSGSPNSIEADHIVPHSLGGPDHPDNVQIICRTCNRRKGSGQARKPHPIVRAEPPTLIEW